MFYYISLILLILYLRNRTFGMKSVLFKQRYETRCCIAVWSIIVLMAALKSPSIAADAMSYTLDFTNISGMSFADISERYEGYLGYYYASKLFSLAGLPVQAWFFFVEALYILPLAKLIDRYSKDKLFSILIFVTTGLLLFSFAGLKQVMAMSFMMFSFLSFIEKRYVLSVLCVALAYTCHATGLIFLASFGVYYFRKLKSEIFLIAIASVIVVTYSASLFSGMVATVGNEHFERYLEQDVSYTYTTLLFYVAIVGISLLAYKNYSLVNSGEFRMVLGLSIIACVLQSLAGYSPNMFRLAYYYTPFFMILLPNVCYYNAGKNDSLIRQLLVVVLVVYFVYTGRNNAFSFFWQ